MIEIIITLITLLIAPNPKHPLYKVDKDPLASEIVMSANEFEIDPIFLTTRIFFESSFMPMSIGKLGEIGYLQTHGKASKMCEEKGFEPGSIRCGAYLFSVGRKQCGDENKETWYATGKCKTDSESWKYRLAYRVWFEKKVRKEVEK